MTQSQALRTFPFFNYFLKLNLVSHSLSISKRKERTDKIGDESKKETMKERKKKKARASRDESGPVASRAANAARRWP